MAKVLENTRELIKSQKMTYKAVVQTVLLYGRKVWVVTDEIMTMIEGFHYSITRQIAGMTAKKGDGGELEWDLVDASLDITGLCLIREYTRNR